MFCLHPAQVGRGSLEDGCEINGLCDTSRVDETFTEL